MKSIFTVSSMPQRAFVGLLALPILAALAPAQQYQLSVDSGASTGSLNGTYEVELDTTVIGDFDMASNPGGTRTVPGFLGGGGNNAIPFDVGLTGSLASNLPPSGTFDLNIDRLAGTLSCTNLNLDLLGGGMILSDLAGDVLFSTFRTFVPDSLFVGGISIPVPLGQQSITSFTAVQNGPALGALSSMPFPGQYLSNFAVPVNVSLIVDFNGVPTPVGPFVGLLPVSATLWVHNDRLDATASFGQTIQQTVLDPLPGFMLIDVPLPIPTVLPAGSTANLLMNGTVESGMVDLIVAGTLTATGPPQCGVSSYCEVNPNSTGMRGLLSITGSTDVAQGDLTLTASQLPANQFGIFLMSPDQGSIVLPAPGQGVLCMGSPFFRFSSDILFSGVSGSVQLPLDFGNLPQGQTFQAGSTWNFQLWHRDQNPSNTSNTTHAATIAFCP